MSSPRTLGRGRIDRCLSRALFSCFSRSDDVLHAEASPWRCFRVVDVLGFRCGIGASSLPLILSLPFRFFSLLSHLFAYVCQCAPVEYLPFHVRNLRCATRFCIFLLSLGSVTVVQLSSKFGGELPELECDEDITSGLTIALSVVHVPCCSRRCVAEASEEPLINGHSSPASRL